MHKEEDIFSVADEEKKRPTLHLHSTDDGTRTFIYVCAENNEKAVCVVSKQDMLSLWDWMVGWLVGCPLVAVN